MEQPSPARGTPLYDAAALRGVETQAAGDDGFALMAKAGQAAWRELLRHWPDAQTLVVVCGPGNNGGDGYVLARHAHASGRTVRVLRLATHAPKTPLARRACDEYEAAGGVVVEFGGTVGHPDVIVDAVFGIGLSRAADGAAAELFAAIAASGRPVLSLDVPSGVDADHGRVPGAAIVATRTLQFIAPHAGLATGAALEHVGRLSLATLDLPAHLRDAMAVVATRFDADDLSAMFAPRPRNTHKGASGRVLCIGGDSGKGGAVMLAAEAALRSGAGLVAVATQPLHVAPLLARCPEAMPVGITSARQLDPMLDTADVVAIGPGLGQGDWGRTLFERALSRGKPLVLDADALNLLAASARLPSHDDILTPHPGEAARLLGISVAEVQANRYAAARLLCQAMGCVVVLKGAGTLVAAPDTTPRVVSAGNPGMAVGGMGDVLTGCIAALRAQGRDAFDAATTGALLHAVAGDDAAGEGGERGLLPSDLLPHLRRRANGTTPGGAR
ncbi:NAD(P)H-hydrate dehydratase [Luteimonas aestuarii]|uniref:Bifunctional NAD(P)H-hydrate repair enzyme n=1 Tax=Luteimonas aestuarii TaxID=453837 RepID=A0A4R5U436_9GAMM|nr:NAD(P)H-hydrate dehydratase [Luteimonas aestuarii]TDK28476.1 NAD(P)H-hydrate dehydratase [Luteimonas aestuarii]